MALGDVVSVGINITMKDSSQPALLILHSGTVQLDLDWRVALVFSNTGELDAWIDRLVAQRKRKAVA